MKPILLALCLTGLAVGQTAERPVRAVVDPGTVTTRQTITPAGVPTIFNGRVYGVTFGSSGDELWVLHATHLYRLDWKMNKVLESVPLGGSPGLQSLVWDGTQALAGLTSRGSGRNDPAAKVHLAAFAGGRKTVKAAELGTFIAGALSVAAE
ncbi:MAG: hypothetical protein JNN08_26040, partial [Bryobacterales bacterium]|nr:hypothetical protein [Bryobacterales bacterium]